MKKRIRKRPPDEIKVIVEKKLDDMERHTTDKQREYFYRKPYGLGDIRDDRKVYVSSVPEMRV